MSEELPEKDAIKLVSAAEFDARSDARQDIGEYLGIEAGCVFAAGEVFT